LWWQRQVLVLVWRLWRWLVWLWLWRLWLVWRRVWVQGQALSHRPLQPLSHQSRRQSTRQWLEQPPLPHRQRPAPAQG
jgi:hypothetical protein